MIVTDVVTYLKSKAQDRVLVTVYTGVTVQHCIK